MSAIMGQWRERLAGAVRALVPGRRGEDGGLAVVGAADPRAGLLAELGSLRARLGDAHRLETLGRLSGGLAHDFQNLLTVILGYSDMLMDVTAPDDRLRASLVREIQRAAEQGAALTAQVLAFGRTAGVGPRPTDLGALTAELELIVRWLAGRRTEVVFAGGPARAFADPAQLRQVIINLVLNARDAMPEGGSLTITTGVAAIGEGAEGPAGRYASVAVADTGCGMDAATQARLFEPFFTTKAPGRGTGLGLALVQDALRQAGGFVRVASVPGRGSTFEVYLPEADAARPARPAVAG